MPRQTASSGHKPPGKYGRVLPVDAYGRPSRGPRAALRHYRNGRRHGYPLCCVLRFAFARLIGDPRPQCAVRGVVRIAPGRSFVPCCRLHRDAEPHRWPSQR